MASAYVPAGALGKLGSASKLLAADATKLGQALGKGLAKTTQATGVNSSLALTTFYNTISEAGFEAHEANKNLREEYARAQGYESYEELPKHIKNVVDLKAGEAAARTFAWNSAALVAPNFIQSKWFLGSAADNADQLRKMVRSGKLKPGQALNEAKSYLSKFGQGFATEGLWEENMQTSIQNYEARLAKGLEQENHIGGPLEHLVNNAWAFTKATFTLGKHAPYAGTEEDEAAMAIMLGGMIGGGMSTVSNYWDAQRKGDTRKAEQTLWEKLKNINAASTNLLVDDYKTPFKQFQEGIINPETGKAEIDPQKIFNLLANGSISKIGIMEQLSSTALADPVWGEFNKAMAAAAHVWRLGSTGMAKQDIKDLLQYDTKENPELGDAQQLMDSMLDLYTNTKQNSFGKEAMSESATDRKYSAFKFRNEFYLNAKKNYLEAMRTNVAFESEERTAQLEELISDVKFELDYLNSDNLKRDFDNEIQYPARLADEIQELTDKIKNDETTEDKAVLADQLEEKLILLNQATNIYGLESIAYGQDLENQGLTPLLKQSSSAFPSFEPRLMSENPRAIKDQVYYHQGNNVLNDGKMDQVETDEELVDFLIDNYEYPSEKSTSTSRRLRDSFSDKALESEDLTKELRLVAEEIEEAKSVAAETGLAPSELIESESGKSLLATGQVGFDKTFQENKDVAEILATQMEQKQLKSQRTADRLTQFRQKMNERGAEMLEYNNTPASQMAELFTKKAIENDVIIPAEAFINDYSRSPSTFFKEQEATTLKRKLRTYKKLFPDSVWADKFTSLEQTIDEIITKIQENKNDRIEVQIFVDEKKVDILRTISMGMEPYMPNSEELFDKIRKGELTSSAAFIYIKAAMDELDTAERRSLLDHLNRQMDNTASSLNSMKSGGLRLAEDIEGIYKNPKKYSAYLLEILADKGLEASDPSSIYYAFTKDKDLYKFMYNYGKRLPEDQKDPKVEAVIDSLSKADVLSTLLALQLSTAEATNIAKVQIEILQEYLAEDATLAPSTQQLMALNDLIFSTFKDEDEWGNVLVLKGVLGSGKSLVGAKLYYEILKKLGAITDDQVLAFGHSKHSSENIAQSLLGDKSKATSLEGFENTNLDGYKLVVVDEAMAMANHEWSNSLGTGIYDRVQEHNANNPDEKIKILALGDASQITVEHPDLTEIGAITHPRTKDTTPLSVIYRTSIPAIADTALTFKDQPNRIESISTTANQSFNEMMAQQEGDNLYGVLGNTTNNPLADIAKLLAKPSAKSRVVIVNNNRQKAAIAEQLGNPENVEVLTYYEAQSRQWDQVYIHMDRNDLNFQDGTFTDLEFNNAMYTMVGRAKEFVYISTPNLKIDTLVNPILESAKDDISRDLTANQIYLSKYLDALSDISGVEVNENNLEDEIIDDEVSDDVQEPVDETQTKPSGKRNRAPQEQPLPITPENVEKKVKDGSPILHRTAHPSSNVDLNPSNLDLDVAQSYIILVESKNGPAYHVISKKQGESNYVTVAVLGANDLMDTDHSPDGHYLLEELLARHPKSAAPAGIGGVNTLASGFELTSAMRDSIVMPIDITYGSNMKYNYDSTTEDGVTKHNFKDLSLKKVLTKLWEGFFNRHIGGNRVEELARTPKTPVLDDRGKLSKHLLKKDVKIAIFSNTGNSTDPYTLDKWEHSKFQPKVGVPYLIIYNLNEEGQKVDTEPQLIRLEPRRINTEDSYFRDIANANTAFKKLQKALKPVSKQLVLGNPHFNNLVKDASKLYEATKDEVILPSSISLVQYLSDYQSNDINFAKLTANQLGKVANALHELITQHTHAPSHEVIKMTKKEAKAAIKADPSLGMQKVVNVSEEIMAKDPSVFALILNKEELENDSSADPEYQKGYVPASKNSRLQKSLNAVAKANNSVNDINIRVKRRTINGDITLSKSVLADQTTYGDFWTKYRAILLSHLEQAVKAAVATGMSLAEAQELFTPRSQNNPEKYASTTRLEKILYSVIKLNQPANYEQTIQEFEQNIQQLKDSISVNTISTKTLDKLLKTDKQGQTSMRLPLLRKSPSSAKTKVGVNDLGSNLSKKGSMEQLEKSLSTSFSGIVPNQLHFEWTPSKTSTPEEQPLPRKAPKKREADSFKPKEGQRVSINQRLSQIIESSKDKELVALSKILLNKIDYENYQAFQDKDLPKGVIGVTYNKSKLSKPKKWMPEVITVFRDMGSVSDSQFIHELIHGFTITTIDKVKAGQGTKAEAAFVENMETLQAEFNSKVTEQGLDIKDFYQPTRSKLDVKEFIASLSYKPFIEKAKSIKFKAGSILNQAIEHIMKLLGLRKASLYRAAVEIFSDFAHKEEEDLKAPIDETDITDLLNDELSFSTDTFDTNEKIIASNGAEHTDIEINETVSRMVKFNLSTKTAKFVLSLLNTHYLNPKLGRAKQIFKLAKIIATIDDSVVEKTLYKTQASKAMIAHLWNKAISFDDKRRIRAILAQINKDPKILGLPINKVRDMFAENYAQYNTFNSSLLTEYYQAIDQFIQLLSEKKPARTISGILQSLESSTKRVNEDHGSAKSLGFIFTNFASTKTYTTARLMMMDFLKAAIDQNESATNGQVVRSREEIIQKVYRDLLKRLVVATKKHRKKGTAQYATEVSALNSLLASDINGTPVYFKMINVIYPKWNLTSSDQIDLFVNVEEDKKIVTEHTEGLRKETEEGAYVDAESRLTDSVKEFFSLIENKDSKRISKIHPNRFYSPRYTFLATAQILINYLDLNNLDNIEEQLAELERSADIGVYETDVLNHLISLITKASRSTSKHKKMFIMEDSFGATRLGFVVSDEDISRDGMVMARKKARYHSVREGSLEKFYEDLKKRGHIDSIEEFNALYVKAKSINTLAELQNSLGSLAEKDYRIGIYKNEGKNSFSVKYINATGFGLEKSIGSTIREFVKSLYEEKGDIKSIYGALSNLIPKLESRDKDAVIDFLKYFELDALINNINVSSRNQSVFEDIAGFIERLNTFNPKTDNIDEFLADQSGFVSSLSRILKANDKLLKASSILDSLGNRIYRYTVKSWFYNMTEMFTQSRASSLFKGATGYLKFKSRSLPAYIRTNFYKNNTFVNGTNKIYRTFEHDSSKNDNSDYSTTFLRESTSDWLFRNFVLGFLSEVDKGPKKLHYTQFLYQVADKPRMPGLEVGILGRKDLKKSIKNAVVQLSNPNTRFGKDVSINFTVYDEAVADLGKDASVNELVNDIYNKLIKQADEFVHALAAKETRVPRNMFKINKALSKVEGAKSFGLDKIKTAKNLQIRNDKREYNTEQVTAAITPAFRLYYVNQYVHNYFINQLYTGPFNAYKHGEDIVKRMAGVMAPGIRPWVDSKRGTPKTTRYLIVEDNTKEQEDIETLLKEMIPDLKEDRLAEMVQFFESFDSTDAQGFMLPER